MCSLNDDEFILEPLNILQTEKLHSDPVACKKCDNMGTITIRQKDTYCESCFAGAVNHKFRASIGKSKFLKNDTNIMLALSGGIGSITMLHLAKEAINVDSHKKLRAIPICFHLNDSRYPETKELLLNWCSKYSMPIHFYDDITYAHEQKIEHTNTESPKNCFSVTGSPTSKKDFHHKVRRELLIDHAKKFGCKYILTGETTTTLAANMLVGVALGRGSQVEHDVGFCDSRNPDVKILRPMKDISSEELLIYAKLNDLQYVDETNEEASLQNLLHKFVVNLQENFPSTISTICKTSEKLSSSTENAINICVICESRLDTDEKATSAIQATEFSRLVSSTGPESSHLMNKTKSSSNIELNNVKQDDSNCQNCSCSAKVNSLFTQAEIEEYACYGCKIMIRELKSYNLSESMKSRLIERKALNNMKNEINDFLLYVMVLFYLFIDGKKGRSC